MLCHECVDVVDGLVEVVQSRQFQVVGETLELTVRHHGNGFVKIAGGEHR